MDKGGNDGHRVGMMNRTDFSAAARLFCCVTRNAAINPWVQSDNSSAGEKARSFHTAGSVVELRNTVSGYPSDAAIRR